jgi:tetratricopeptide (TPR) repeat protein
MISRDSRNPDLHYYLGLAYLADKKPELALMEFKTVNEIGNFSGACKEIPFRKKIAELYAFFGQTEEALKERLLLTRLEPGEPEHYYESGLLFEDRNQADKAIGYFRKALEIDPRHPDAHFRLGLILYRNKKPVESKIEIESAIKYKQDNYAAYYYLGRLLKEGHDYVGALLSFERAQKDPEFKIKSLVERGTCYMSQSNYDSAIAELERSIKLIKDESANDSLYARYFLAGCYEQLRDIDKAVEQWEKVYSKKPNFRDVAEKLGQYQELRTDDKMKDYLTGNQDQFSELCKKVVVNGMTLSVQDMDKIPNGCQIIATENDNAKWRNTRKLPRLIWFLRVPESIDDSTLRNMQETMKQMQITRGHIITSSAFSRKAVEFSESRPIELVTKDRLLEMLKKT